MTGVLPITLDEARKVTRAFLASGKEYVCVMRLHGSVGEDKIREGLDKFVGEIYQMPPVRASVKRRLRTRRVYYIKFLERSGRNVLLRVGCQAGTYIRKLCFHIGLLLGCGAHMAELRRTRAGPFREEESVTLYDLLEAYSVWREEGDEGPLRRVVRPLEEGLSLMPKVYVRDSAVDAICHGAHLAIPGMSKLETGIKPGDVVAIMTLKGEAVALGRALMSSEQMLEVGYGLAVRTERVIMRRGTYPRRWRARPRSTG